MSANDSKLPASLDRIVQRFARQSDPKMRYEQLIYYAKRLPEFPESEKVTENKVPGCVSQVYITAELKEEKVFFAGDSDSQLVKGLVGLLIEGLSGLTADEILTVKPDFIQQTGLNISLTPSRSNGFYNIFQTMQRKVMLLGIGNGKIKIE